MPIDYPGSDDYPSNIVIPADADPADGESVRVPMRQLADRTTWLANAITPAPGVRRWLTFHPSVFRHFDESGAPADGINPSTPRNGGAVVVASATIVLACPLNRILPAGAKVELVEVLLSQTATPPAGAELRLIQTVHDFVTPALGTPTVVASDTSPSITAPHTIGLLGSPLATMAEGESYHLTLSQLAGSILIHGMRIRFEDVRARNY